jgi:glycosyltransferase involved in cell wall biosynthesis
LPPFKKKPKSRTLLLATESYYPNVDGGAIFERNLAWAMARRGWKVHILAPATDFQNKKDTDGPTTIHRLRAVKIPFLQGERTGTIFPNPTVDKIVLELKPDIIHIHNPFGIGRAALAAAKKYQIPTLATNHLLPENLLGFIARLSFMEKSKALQKFDWFFIVDFHNHCDFVTSPTRTAVDLLIQNGLTAKSQPVSNGINLKKFRPASPKAANYLRKRWRMGPGPVVLYTGRISGEKNLDVLVKAFAIVAGEIPDAQLMLGGAGREEDNLKKLAQKLGLGDKTFISGFLNNPKDFPHLYHLGAVFVIPSTAELQSIVTMEAMASGLPVIGVKKYALPELIHHGKNGFLFRPGDFKTLARQIIQILRDKKLRKTMGRESLKMIKVHAFEKTVADYEKIYSFLINNKI